jgi:dihydropyrimidinase
MGTYLITGGTIVTAADTITADVLIDGERIAAILAPDSALATQCRRDGTQIVDAEGCYVIPGGIDPHTHFQAEGQALPVLDTFATGTRAAALGGTTTIIDFAYAPPGGRPPQGLAWYHSKADSQCAVDYGFHMMLTECDGETPSEVDELMALGVTSFKMYTAYTGTLYSPDDVILRMLQHSARTGALMMLHAENGPAIDVLREQAVEAGHTAPRYHADTRPAALEAEAIHRITRLAEVAGAPVYIVHLSSAEGLEELIRARARGVRALAETCPQYLFLDEDSLALPGFEGANFVCSPPLRPRDGQNHLWQGLADRFIQNVATDHCPFCRDQREPGVNDFRAIPNGLPGVEHRLEQIFHGGVVAGKVTLNRWVEICSTAPARIFGLYPRKGTLAPGSDADVVIFDPHAEHVLSAETHHMNVDYSVYEGQRLSGAVRTVLLRGKVVVEDGQYRGTAGDGRFLPRGLSVTDQ